MTQVEAAPKAIEREELLTGCEAVAQAVMLADVDVIAAYPIRPYTEVMDAVSKLIADGKFFAEYIIAEGEHSQFEIVKHASSVGARVFAGSSGTGWMYAMEALAVTASDRLPVVAMVGNRALDDPGAFGVEHNDALTVRDLGWLLVWVATAQEALDTALISYRVAEDQSVMFPLAIALDGGFLTHSQHIVKIPSAAQVRRFLPPYALGKRRLHPDNPISIAPQVNEDWVMEIRKQNAEATKKVPAVVDKAYKEFEEVFQRSVGDPWLEEYMMEDAELAIVGMGTLAITAKAAIKRMRKQGVKVGLVRQKWYRPYPTERVRKALSGVRAVAVVDRDFSYGSPFYGGVLYNEIRSALYSLSSRPIITNFIAGLGGREISIAEIMKMLELTEKAKREDNRDQVMWMGVRE
ncbi:MAG: pyruvate ferredoxin oxidoreductase [Thaumarchaeota archaeon]|nr:MAG: pyruvate ferredoxin oxidoreductase [Nitrososphaerota archaeon]